MADQEQTALTRLIQQLAESGDYAGFNAIVSAIGKDVEAQALESLKRDPVQAGHLSRSVATQDPR